MSFDPHVQNAKHKYVNPYDALPVFREQGGVSAVQRAMNVGYVSADGIIRRLLADRLIERLPTDRSRYRLTESGVERIGVA
jgi:predicted transcriptional regulator